jgi:hypothetical protein
MDKAEINIRYKSVSHRILAMRSLREAVFCNTVFDHASTLLRFECEPVLQDHVEITQMYHRETTHTWVWRLKDKTGHLPDCVLKVFLIKPPKPDPGSKDAEGNAESHELEVRFLRMFSYMARCGVSPHVVFPVGHTVFTAEHVRRFVQRHKKQTVPDGNYMVLLSECATSSVYADIVEDKLTAYNLKVVLFQVVYTLMVIQQAFPSFRHNDLHLSNVLTQEFDVHGVDRYTLVDSDCVHVDLARAPRRALLWDMYFSSISMQDAQKYNLQTDHVVPSAWVETRHCNNNYYDMHKFFDSLEYALNFRDKHKQKYRAERELINAIVPERLKCLTKNRTRVEKRQMKLWDQCVIRPLEVLQLPYFQDLRAQPPGPIIKKYCCSGPSRSNSADTKSSS